MVRLGVARDRYLRRAIARQGGVWARNLAFATCLNASWSGRLSASAFDIYQPGGWYYYRCARGADVQTWVSAIMNDKKNGAKAARVVMREVVCRGPVSGLAGIHGCRRRRTSLQTSSMCSTTRGRDRFRPEPGKDRHFCRSGLEPSPMIGTASRMESSMHCSKSFVSISSLDKDGYGLLF